MIDFAELPLQAEIMIKSSITLSLILLLPLCTMQISWSRIEVSILTDVSPLLNFLSSHLAGLNPSRSQIASARTGWEDPEKIFTRRIVGAKRGNAQEGRVMVVHGNNKVKLQD